jgi:hypothetical protein
MHCGTNNPSPNLKGNSMTERDMLLMRLLPEGMFGACSLRLSTIIKDEEAANADGFDHF